jgi:hypothetical protein
MDGIEFKRAFEYYSGTQSAALRHAITRSKALRKLRRRRARVAARYVRASCDIATAKLDRRQFLVARQFRESNAA